MNDLIVLVNQRGKPGKVLSYVHNEVHHGISREYCNETRPASRTREDVFSTDAVRFKCLPNDQSTQKGIDSDCRRPKKFQMRSQSLRITNVFLGCWYEKITCHGLDE